MRRPMIVKQRDVDEVLNKLKVNAVVKVLRNCSWMIWVWWIRGVGGDVSTLNGNIFDYA